MLMPAACVGTVAGGSELGAGSPRFSSYAYLLCEPWAVLFSFWGSFSLTDWTVSPLRFSFTFDSL